MEGSAASSLASDHGSGREAGARAHEAHDDRDAGGLHPLPRRAAAARGGGHGRARVSPRF